ncbi:hypothetical protein GCM10020370_68210 [Paenibacillus hodogayensis]
MFERNRSKAVEMLARFKDHATGTFYKGFRMLTMGWRTNRVIASLRVVVDKVFTHFSNYILGWGTSKEI